MVAVVAGGDLGATSWFAIISHLARDNIKRTRNSLMRTNEPTQKPQDVNDDSYDASGIDQWKQP